MVDPAYDDWYRIYLPDPEESERNEEWIPPDEYYHTNDSLFNLGQMNYPREQELSSSKKIAQENHQLPKKILGDSAKLIHKGQKFDLNSFPTSSITWNALYEVNRDYIYHSLVLTCFNKAFCILDKNRELLDFFAVYLTRYEIIRQHEINEVILQFKNSTSMAGEINFS